MRSQYHITDRRGNQRRANQMARFADLRNGGNMLRPDVAGIVLIITAAVVAVLAIWTILDPATIARLVGAV